MLSALEGQNEVFLGQCTKLVLSRVDSQFFARQLSYSLLAILSYYASTAGSAATAVFDWSMHRQTFERLPFDSFLSIYDSQKQNIHV